MSQTVTIGDEIPPFESDATGGPMRIADHRGTVLVLYFYPKDGTPGCTTETQEFGEAVPAFADAGAVVFGISRDSLRSHQRFKEMLGIPFELVSDPDEALCATFGVMKTKNMYGQQVRGVDRSTFVVDGDGRLVREWRGVKVPGHVAEVLEYVKSL